MSEEILEKWEKEHKAMPEENAADHFLIRHYVAAAELEKLSGGK